MTTAAERLGPADLRELFLFAGLDDLASADRPAQSPGALVVDDLRERKAAD